MRHAFLLTFLMEVEQVRQLVSTMYPVVVLDEFQDTNEAPWRVVQALGELSTLFALADPEQRIFDFIGADPQRLQQFRDRFALTEIDLSTENRTSAGTDITTFGNDILRGDSDMSPTWESRLFTFRQTLIRHSPSL